MGEGAAQLGGFPHATQQGHVRWHCGCRLHTHTHKTEANKELTTRGGENTFKMHEQINSSHFMSHTYAVFFDASKDM